MSKRELRQNLYRTMHAASNDLIQYGGVLEQERIIKLLADECECDGTDDGWNYCVYHKAIDRIKGRGEN